MARWWWSRGRRGLGAELARAFAAKRVRVAAVDVLDDALHETVAAIDQAGGRATAIHADITSVDEVRAMVEAVEGRLGPIDVQINNAGTFSVVAPVWECDPARWFHDVRVNLYGSFLCCRAVAGRMAARGSGYILNIVSAGGVGDPHAYSTSYACSKTALMRLTEGLARELEPHGVKVFAIAPPAIRTAMTEFLMSDSAAKKWRPGFAGIFERGDDHPAEIVSAMAIKLVGGQADLLTGRYFLATANFEEVVARAAEILEEDRFSLRIRF